MFKPRPTVAWAAAGLLALAAVHAAPAAAGSSCQAFSPATPPLVLELFTSEGCSSCPPADRWLSTLKGRSDVLPLAFHVTYWDRLGWPDRYGLREATERQYHLAALSGSAQVYTPQVLANGQDRPDWHNWRAGPRLPATGDAAAALASPALTLQRDDDAHVRLQVAALPGRSGRLAGYWAVLEDGHRSRVTAGENAGETLQHDHVVRLFRPVPAWPAAQGLAATLDAGRGVPAYPRRVVFVLTDEAGRRPLQAVQLGC